MLLSPFWFFFIKTFKYCQIYTAKCKVSTNKNNSCMGSLHWGHHWSSFYFANFGTRKNINFFYTLPKCLFFFCNITRHWVRGVTKKLQQTDQRACLWSLAQWKLIFSSSNFQQWRIHPALSHEGPNSQSCPDHCLGKPWQHWCDVFLSF